MGKKEHFQTKIKIFREQLNMTQSDLASLVGVSRETITYLEKGKYNPSLKLAFNISKVFNSPIEEIFIFNDDE
jgi:putative transcriptional regulator